jgi:lipopolysaccharide export system permease protein
MKTIDRYIAGHTIRGIVVVLGVFIILFSFFELLGQLNDVGKGTYRLQDAFVFVALTVPKRTIDLLPICILLGSIISLGLLADHHELVAMQASGISVRRICRAVLLAGALFVLAAIAVAEFVAPPIDQQARIMHFQAIYGKGIMLTKTGFWTRYGRSFIHVGKTFSGGSAADIDIYEHDEQGRLRRFIYAREAAIMADGKWLLKGIEEKTFSEQGISTQNPSGLTLDSFLSLAQVGILELPPDSLSLSDLYHYIRGLHARGQNAKRYTLSLWQKLSMPLMDLVMLLLSLTFIFGPTRTVTAGRRIVLASLFSIGLYLLNQVIGHLGLLFDLPPALTTMAPVAAILGVALWLLSRVR